MQAIQTGDLKTLMSAEENLMLVNTLDQEHFDKTRIPGAINIPQSQDQFAEKVEAATGDKSRPVVVYCASADCNSSTKAAKKLDAAGFSQVLDYEVGAKGWKDSGESLGN
ncbi:rhodanese-like domain-containing protein [Roseiconus nitratireducens]|uniref:Rhodanese-like domain-containing protein n=1 Tax=Roseiconus nitratireducens TaxID=2605748 RepID=A0A5M6DCT7_9BACT|nr:rhodanese-like domain-containing protein [Roseiconus nitratireducens]KAA5545387.1 rhodanese-like domain-containing protein [Roseiconus nitratireducens]